MPTRATRPAIPTRPAMFTIAGRAPLPMIFPVSASYLAKRLFGALHCGHSKSFGWSSNLVGRT